MQRVARTGDAIPGEMQSPAISFAGGATARCQKPARSGVSPPGKVPSACSTCQGTSTSGWLRPMTPNTSVVEVVGSMKHPTTFGLRPIRCLGHPCALSMSVFDVPDDPRAARLSQLSHESRAPHRAAQLRKRLRAASRNCVNVLRRSGHGKGRPLARGVCSNHPVAIDRCARRFAKSQGPQSCRAAAPF